MYHLLNSPSPLNANKITMSLKGNFPIGLTRTLISVSRALINFINKIQVNHYFNLEIQLKHLIIFLRLDTSVLHMHIFIPHV